MVSRRLAVATTLFLLCSCGGGDNTGNAGASSLVAPAPLPSPPRPPLSASDWGMRSLYGGTITGASTQDIIVVIDGAGALWGVYGTGASTDFRPVGMILSSTPSESRRPDSPRSASTWRPSRPRDSASTWRSIRQSQA